MLDLDTTTEAPVHVPDLDDYDGPPSPQPRQCTCAGTAPGYPQHETGCGEPEPDEDDEEEYR